MIAGDSNCGNSTSANVFRRRASGNRRDLVKVLNRFSTESYCCGVFTVRFGLWSAHFAAIIFQIDNFGK